MLLHILSDLGWLPKWISGFIDEHPWAVLSVVLISMFISLFSIEFQMARAQMELDDYLDAKENIDRDSDLDEKSQE